MTLYKDSSIKLSILLTVFIVISLSGCFSHWQGDLAKIVISFGNADRGVDYNHDNPNDPETLRKLTHEIVLTNETDKLEFSFTGTTFEAYVASGEWNVSVVSYRDGGVYAAGSEDVILKLGQDNRETIRMYQAHQVKFDSNKGNGEVQPIVIKAKNSITLPGGGELSKAGYTFSGWNTNSGGTGTNYAAGSKYTPTDNITLYAKWVAAPTLTGTVSITGTATVGQTITANTGSLGGSGTITYKWKRDDSSSAAGNNISGATSSTYTLTTADVGKYIKVTVTRNGYSGNITSAAFGPVQASSSSTYTVTYNINGGTGTVPASQTVAIGSNITLPSGSGISKKGYNFDGWNTYSSGTGSNYTAGNSYKPSGNITLYAKWKILTEPEGNTLDEKLDWFYKNAVEGGNYTVRVTGIENINGQKYLGSEDDVNYSITLTGGGTVKMNATDFDTRSWINVISKTKLTLENITLTGSPNNYRPVVCVNGELIMNNNTTITGNTNNNADNDTGIDGGGVFVSEGGKFTMNGGTISGNTNRNGGGVIIWRGTFTMSGNAVISGNTGGNVGGGVHVEDRGNFIMSGGTISGNNAPSGSGVYIDPSAEFTMTSGKILGANTAEHGGGGVEVHGKFTMSGTSEISGNFASTGGGVWVGPLGTFNMKGGQIFDNKATIANGGGVHVEEGKFEMEGGKIRINTANNSGGGVSVYKGTFTMSGDAEISNNTATIWAGGGVDVYGKDDGKFTMISGTIFGNIANVGGGVNVSGGTDDDGKKFFRTFDMNGGKIHTNTTIENGGGGVNVAENGIFNMNGGEIYNNTAPYAGGVNVWKGKLNKVAKDTGGGSIHDNIVSNGSREANASSNNDVYPTKVKNSSIWSKDELKYDGTTDPPTFSGVWDN